MRKLIYIILFPVLLFAQYGQQEITNTTFADGTGWTLLGTVSISGGTVNIPAVGGTGNQAYTTALVTSFVFGDHFRIKYDVTANTYNSSTDALYMQYVYSNGSSVFLPTDLSVGYHVLQCRVTTEITNFKFRTRSGATTGSISIDNARWFHKQDTLWIDSVLGDNTDADTCQTLTEAFVTRGAHSGGTFITESTTFDESVTIDSSFTLWRSATAGTGTYVTAVDFNGVTATLLDVYVTTPTNDSNITYTYTPAATTETPKRKFGSYGVWRGW